MNAAELWQRYQRYLCRVPSLGLTLDVSRMRFEDGFLERMAPSHVSTRSTAMDALEKGAIANPDENRMVGHYWLRAPDLAPTPEIAAEIRKTIADIKAFAAERPRRHNPSAHGARFTGVLSIGIGGSALGPMFVADALGRPGHRPDADRLHRQHRPGRHRRAHSGVWRADSPRRCASSPRRAAARRRPATACCWSPTPTERPGSTSRATPSRSPCPARRWTRPPRTEGWLARFPMYDWVGGRTSELSAVGLLPAALQGLDIDGLLAGAAACDEATRRPRPEDATRPALMALMWHHATGGKGQKDMVVLPYKDRLLLFSRYLQQLVMESIGKQLDLQGQRVEQGLTRLRQQGLDRPARLRPATPRGGAELLRRVHPGAGGRRLGARGRTGGHGRRLPARLPARDAGGSVRERPGVDDDHRSAGRRPTVGALIALFERAVGFYASLVGINAYHQPGA